ncbi:MAG: hypothetical protein ABJA93_09765 [Sporichthyaceae bacterium]
MNSTEMNHALTAMLIAMSLASSAGCGGASLTISLDKAVHLLSFAFVTWSGARVGLPIRWLVAALTVHAVTSELIQHALLPGRSGDSADVLADLAGVASVALPLGAASWRDGRVARGRERDDGAAPRGEPRAR